MRNFLVKVTVPETSLGELISAVAKFDSEITAMALPQDPAPEPIAMPPVVTLPRKPPKKIVRARKDNGGAWPPPGSIYSRVLEALEGGPKSPGELRDFLKASGFAGSSVGSALNRLEKRGKIKNDGDGAWSVPI